MHRRMCAAAFRRRLRHHTASTPRPTYPVIPDAIRLKSRQNRPNPDIPMRDANPYSSPATVVNPALNSDATPKSLRAFWFAISLAASLPPAAFVICELLDSTLEFYLLNAIFWPPVIIGLVV